jgi:hypothetical protein
MKDNVFKRKIYIKESPNYRQEHTLGYKVVLGTTAAVIWFATIVAALLLFGGAQ